MAMLGYNVIPVVFIIPIFNILSIICTAAILHQVKNQQLQIIDDQKTHKSSFVKAGLMNIN
jgi:hypothetical protein